MNKPCAICIYVSTDTQNCEIQKREFREKAAPFRRTDDNEDSKSETSTLDVSDGRRTAQTFQGEDTGRKDFKIDEAHHWGVAPASLLPWI